MVIAQRLPIIKFFFFQTANPKMDLPPFFFPEPGFKLIANRNLA